MATEPSPSLWRHPDFLKLWVGQAVSQIGSQISFLALPLVATLALNATPLQMGLLTAASSLPALLVGLHAGVFVDRHRRRPVLIAGDIGRALVLGCVPLAWLSGHLSLALLYAVALVAGTLTLFFNVAYQALLPTLVPRDRLTDANGKLELSATAAQIAGPSLAGWLVRLLTAPLAVTLDALSYLLSALLLSRLRTREPQPAASARKRPIRSDIGTGLCVVVRDPLLRALVGGRGLLELFNAVLEAAFVLYVVRALGVGPALLGVNFSVGSVGFLVGALLPVRVSRRAGFGPATAGGLALVGFSDLLVPLAGGSLLVVVPLLVAAQFFFGLGLTVFNVNQVSLRQAVVPDHLRGRTGATVRVLATGLVPLGALAGGVLGELLGLRTTLILAALGDLLAAAWIWRSPLRLLRDLPSTAEPVVAEPA